MINTVKIGNTFVHLSIAEGLDASIETVKESNIFQDWVASIDPKFVVNSIHIQSIDMFGERIGFIKLKADITKDGIQVPGIVFLRGGTVVLLPLLECDGNIYTILTVQARVPTGESEFSELPAGMVDNGTFSGAAAKELQEETGLEFGEDELISLSDIPIYFSPGVSDELAKFYMVHRDITYDELYAMQDKCMGELHEGEQITLKVIPVDDLTKVTNDGKSLIAWTLYLRFKEYASKGIF